VQFADDKAGKENLSALQAEEHVIAAALYGKDNNRIAEYVRPGTKAEFPNDPPTDGHRFDGNGLTVSRPVMLNDKRIGAVYLRSDLNAAYSRLRSSALILFLIVLGAVSATWAVVTRLRKPIVDLIVALP